MSLERDPPATRGPGDIKRRFGRTGFPTKVKAKTTTAAEGEKEETP